MKDFRIDLPPEKKDEYGFTKKQNKEIEEYLTRPKVNSDGAWKNFVDENKYIEKLKKFGTENSQHPAEKYYDDKMKEIDKKGTSYLSKHLKKANVINHIEKTRSDNNDPILENRGKQTIALNHTANKYLNNQVKKGNIKKEDLMLQPDKNGLLTNKSKTIAMRDSFMAKQFNNALGVNDYPTEASPEQFGALAERLERNRQQQGKRTDLKEFGHRFNENQKAKYPGMKTWEKKKISKPMEPVKIELSSYTPFVPIDIPKRDPEMDLATKRFEKLSNDIREEKNRNAHSGSAGIVGGDPKYYGK